MPEPAQPTPRQRLLDAAAELFYRHGIGAVGVDRVASTAGVSKRTLYQQFGSKDELIARSLDAHGPDILGLYLPAGPGDGAPRDQILAVFDRLADWSAATAFRGCPFVNTATELADPGHPARKVAREYTLRIREFFAGAAAHGHADDPEVLADQLIVLFDGAIVQAVMGTSLHPDATRSAVGTLLDARGLASSTTGT